MRFQDPETKKIIEFTDLDGVCTENKMENYLDCLIDDIRKYGDIDKDNFLIVPADSFDLYFQFFEENGWEYIGE